MNSKIIKNGILALAFTLVAVPAQAAFGFANTTFANTTTQAAAGSCDSYDSEINRLFQAQDLRGATITSMKTTMEQLAPKGTFTTRQLNAIAEEIVDIIYPKMKVALGRILQQNFSVEELRQINAFYETPVGKKLNSLQPVLMQTGMQVAQQSDVQAQIQQIVQKHLGNK